MQPWSLRNAEELRICTNSLVAADHVSTAQAILQAVAACSVGHANHQNELRWRCAALVTPQGSKQLRFELEGPRACQKTLSKSVSSTAMSGVDHIQPPFAAALTTLAT